MGDTILDYLGEGEILCQLAEEAAELGKAALKYRRACGYTRNVTPATKGDAYKNLLEEVADVMVCLSVLGLDSGVAAIEVRRTTEQKLARWYKRLNDSIGKPRVKP